MQNNDSSKPSKTQQYDTSYRRFLSTNYEDSGVKYRYSGDLLLVYSTARMDERAVKAKNKRGVIRRFSATCGGRMRSYLRECNAQYRYMVTLTYPKEYPIDGAVVKSHLKRFLQEMFRLVRANGKAIDYSSFWFLEFQARGAPHFHIFTTHFFDCSWVSQTWYEIVASNDKKHLKAGTKTEKLLKGRKGTISYASKYAAKQCQKVIPANYLNCGRFWGVSGLKTRQSATCVFYNDLLQKTEISSLKCQIDVLIRGLARTGAIRLIKRVKCFAMFHVEHICSDLMELKRLICEAERLRCETEFSWLEERRTEKAMFDADIDDLASLIRADNILNGYQAYAELNYEAVKEWGNMNFKEWESCQRLQ